MINKIPVYIFLLLIVSCKDNSSSKNKTIDNKASRSTSLDTVYISDYPGIELYELKDKYNKVVHTRNEFFNDVFIDPESTYSTYFKPGKEGLFTSEFGVDAYFQWYAYFLKKKYKEETFKEQRLKLIQLYDTLNRAYSIMDQGGSSYGHNIPRIHAYVEWDIYNTYIINKPSRNVSNAEFLKAKTLFTIHNDKVIDSVFSSGIWMRRPYNSRKATKEKVKYLFDKIDVAIVNPFYLNKVSDFQKKYNVYYNN